MVRIFVTEEAFEAIKATRFDVEIRLGHRRGFPADIRISPSSRRSPKDSATFGLIAPSWTSWPACEGRARRSAT
jgi:hypothetical protein